MYKNIILKEKNVFEENNNLYLKLVYEFEDKRGVHELIIPKIELEISTNQLPAIQETPEFTLCSAIMESCILRYSENFKLLPGKVVVRKNKKIQVYPDAAYIINTITEKPIEMTLTDIEEKLGYKINLVSEKGNDRNECRN